MDEKSKLKTIVDDKHHHRQSKNQMMVDHQSDMNNVIDDTDNQQQKHHPASNECNNFESFKKNAVHVNDLENHWHQEVVSTSSVSEMKKQHANVQQQHDLMSPNPNRSMMHHHVVPKNEAIIVNKTFSSSSSSPKSNNKQSKQQQMCFISCLRKYRNVCLQDTAELSINNYANLVNFIYTRKW